MWARPGDVLFLCRVQHGWLAVREVELPAIFFGNVGGFDKGGECAEGVFGGEDEDFAGGDGVEPSFYPGPDCGEE